MNKEVGKQYLQYNSFCVKILHVSVYTDKYVNACWHVCKNIPHRSAEIVVIYLRRSEMRYWGWSWGLLFSCDNTNWNCKKNI